MSMARCTRQTGKEKARKLSTCLLLALLCIAPGASVAQSQQNGIIEIRQDSPTSYTVVRGDTLWDIAGRFLEEPWLWPQVWEVNPQIENPDLIYPGDVIELAYVDGQPVLRFGRSEVPSELPTVRLSPQVRRESILSPIPPIGLDQISSYLSKDSVVSQINYDAAPYLLAEAMDRLYISRDDKVYARGNWTSGITTFDIVRKGREFLDPVTGRKLGIEALAVGTARLQSISGDKAILSIESNYQEIKSGDRLMPSHNIELQSRYLPTPPTFNVDAAIISIGSGKDIAGLYDSLVFTKGRQEGMEPGQVLVVTKPPRMVIDQHGPKTAWEQFKSAFGRNPGNQLEFPGERVATVLVYQVFDEVSVALVLKSTDVIRLNDRVMNP